MSAAEIPEALIKFVQALSEDDDLRAWLLSFEETPDFRRRDEFRALVRRMQAAGEHPELLQATALLENPEIYRAVCAAIRDVAK